MLLHEIWGIWGMHFFSLFIASISLTLPLPSLTLHTWHPSTCHFVTQEYCTTWPTFYQRSENRHNGWLRRLYRTTSMPTCSTVTFYIVWRSCLYLLRLYMMKWQRSILLWKLRYATRWVSICSPRKIGQKCSLVWDWFLQRKPQFFVSFIWRRDERWTWRLLSRTIRDIFNASSSFLDIGSKGIFTRLQYKI